MRSAPHSLEEFLEDLARGARPGDRVPPIRDLMRRFGASQKVVQREFQALKSKGLIASQVGRGTFFQPGGGSSTGTASAAAPVKPGAARSVLLLRRSISVIRGRVLAEGLQRRFAADGHRVLEVSYTDPDHARTVLKSLPRFDACVIQSTFKTITIDLLAALKEKIDVLAVDGTALVGTDVESVGIEWGEPLATAVDLLRQNGHRRICYATTSHSFLANQLGLRRFDCLQKIHVDCEMQSIVVPNLPDENYDTTLVGIIKAGLDAAGRPPFDALIAWGIEDGGRFRKLLAGIGLEIPSALSVVLLGRTDLPNEHADFFDAVGCRVADQVDYLHRAITSHWTDPSMPYGLTLIPVDIRPGNSIGAPRKPGREEAQVSRRRLKTLV